MPNRKTQPVDKRMSKRLRIKTAAVIAVVILCVLGIGVVLFNAQHSLVQASYDVEIQQSADQLPDLLAEASDDAAQSIQTYDELFKSKAQSVAFIANNNAGFEETDTKMQEYAQLLEVDNVLLVHKNGEVVAKAKETQANFTSKRFDRLRTVFDTGEASEAVAISLESQGWEDRYYAAQIDDNTMVVIEQNPEQLNKMIDDAGSLDATLSNVTVGQNGYVVAVSAKDHLITYHPRAELIGADALDEGVNAEDLEDGKHFMSYMDDGTDLYCSISQVDDTYYIFCVPESDMASARTITVGFILFVCFSFMLALALYTAFVMQEDHFTGTHEDQVHLFGKLYFNKTIAGRSIALSVFSLVAILAVAFYMQTLFALSAQSVTNNQRLDQISTTIANNEEREAQLKSEYEDFYLDKCRVAAYVMDQNNDLKSSKEKLYELQNVLQIAGVTSFDGDGLMIASSTAQKNYQLSEDPNDSSYEFRYKLLEGRSEQLVQSLSYDELTGESRQYIGVITHDETGYANGLVQIAVRPTRLENLISTVQIDKILSNVRVGSTGFAFAVSKEDNTIAWAPNENLIGKSAEEAGLTESELVDGFSNYLTLNGQEYYANCKETTNYYLFVAGPEGELMAERLPLTMLTGIGALVCFIILFCILTIGYRRRSLEEIEAAEAAAQEPVADQHSIDVVTADGSKKKSDSAVSRWINNGLRWSEKTPEQKLQTVVKWLLGVMCFIVFFAIVFHDKFFQEGSIFHYILDGGWEHGLNIFAVTASIMYACAAVVVAAILQWVLRLLANVSGARGETICRLLSSVVKYGTIVFMLYWCFGVLGVDTTTMLASAGIITLAVGFGAQQIVNDIVSGLFIIFEGEFRVGDIIEVGGDTGTVMDIGVRTTKIKDSNDNVLIIRNSNISDVTNKTRMNSSATVDIMLLLGESLPYVENVLQSEFPNVKKRVPSIIDGPFYKGVMALDDTTMTLRVVATCAEADRGALERTLKREMALLFARNNVAPFQVVYEHDDASSVQSAKERLEQHRADQFSKQQQEAAKELGNQSESN